MEDNEVKEPNLSIALALFPLVLLIFLLGLSVFLFGSDSSYGANQIALVMATFAAAIVGAKIGIPWAQLQEGILNGIMIGLVPVLILLAVGGLIGTWILCGTVPSMIYYGVQILEPSMFYAASSLISAVVAVSIGSSWTVAGTLGIGLMGISTSFGLSPAITAGAIISGAYFGDKLSPLSDTTNLASAVAGQDLFEHIKHMLWTTIPGYAITLIILLIISESIAASPDDIRILQENLRSEFNIGLHLLLPLIFMLILIYKRIPAYPAIVISSLFGAVFAAIFQSNVAADLANSPGLSINLATLKGIWISLFDGFQLNSGNEFLDKLLSKGGMSSMLNTVWLIVTALGFGGILETTGILRFLINRALKGVTSAGSLISATTIACVGTNALTADQYMGISLPGRMFKDEYEKIGLSRLNLSRTIEDSATMTSALIPWNTCGAYMSATLGVATISYAPYAFLNWLCPLIAISYGFLGIALKPSGSSSEVSLDAN